MAILDAGLLFVRDDDARAEAMQHETAMEKFGLESVRVRAAAAPEVAPVRLLLQFEGSLDEAIAAGFEPTTVAGDVAAGTIRINRLDELAQVSSVRFAEASRPMHGELDVSVQLIGAAARHAATPPNRGANVIVGIIDSGVDFKHEGFRDAAGKSRILAIWDQRLTPLAHEAAPAGFIDGVEYTKADIDAALAGTGTVRHTDMDKHGHGTHVAGIAAGNGRAAPASTFVGVAPDADILVVANQGAAAMGDSSSTLDAVKYLLDKATALGRPIAINLSQGDNLGPHDGTSLLERGIDNLLGKPGQALVKSAGNARAQHIHAAGRINAAGGTEDLTFDIDEDDRSADVIDVWYAGSDDFEAAVIPPTGAGTAFLGKGNHPLTKLPNGNSVKVASFGNDPFNNDKRITVTISPGTQAEIEEGTWTIRLRGVTVADGSFHAWIQRDNLSQPRFVGPLADDRFTITIPGTAKKVVTVGAFVCKAGGGGVMKDLAHFSSIGPTRDNRQKPDLAAPGETIMSARKAGTGAGGYVSSQGTSMAAPHVTGAMALLLEQDPTLDCVQLAANLGTIEDSFTGAPARPEWGRGKLSI